MAGHSKWSKVKHIKAVVDARRSKRFSQFSKEITIAARLGGGDVDMNPRLRTAVLNAKRQSMPGDNIERAIKKGSGELGGEAIEEILYEGYGPQGTAFLIEAATDNKNRTAADIRTIFNKNHGTIGTPNSVAYNFDRIGEIRVVAAGRSEDELMEQALEAGAEDFEVDDEEFVIRTRFVDLYPVAQTLEAAGVATESVKPVYRPQTTLELTDAAVAAQAIKLFEALEDNDDVQAVFANFDVADGVLEEATH